MKKKRVISLVVAVIVVLLVAGYPPAEKVAILRRHLVEGVPIADVSDEQSMGPPLPPSAIRKVAILLWLGKEEELEGVTKNGMLLHHVEGLAQRMANGQRRNNAGGGFTLSVTLREMAMDTAVIAAASIHHHRIIAPARQVASYLIFVLPKILRRFVL
jgi:hypothetical protein